MEDIKKFEDYEVLKESKNIVDFSGINYKKYETELEPKTAEKWKPKNVKLPHVVSVEGDVNDYLTDIKISFSDGNEYNVKVVYDERPDAKDEDNKLYLDVSFNNGKKVDITKDLKIGFKDWKKDYVKHGDILKTAFKFYDLCLKSNS